MVALGANIAKHQARPILRDEASALVRKFAQREPMTSLVFWLMWKTASRFQDVSELKRQNFLVVTESEMILVFGKYKKGGTVKKTSLCHIRSPIRMIWRCRLLN